MPFGWEMSLCLKKDFTVKDIKKKRKNIKKKRKTQKQNSQVRRSPCGEKSLAQSEAG